MESTSYPVGIVSYFLVLASFTVSTPQSLMKNLWNRPWKYGIPILAKFFCLYRITEENNLPRRRTRISWPGDSKLLPGRCQTRQDGERIGKIGERKGVRMYIRLYSDPYAHVSPNLLFRYSASTVEYLVASYFADRVDASSSRFPFTSTAERELPCTRVSCIEQPRFRSSIFCRRTCSWNLSLTRSCCLFGWHSSFLDRFSS